MSGEIDTEAVAYEGCDGKPVTVGALMKDAQAGSTTAEFCPYCDYTPEIPVIGGFCPECGHWLLPCSMCDWRLNDCGDGCPFEGFRQEDRAHDGLIEVPSEQWMEEDE